MLITRSRMVGESTRIALVTLTSPTGARYWFPSFDQPNMKVSANCQCTLVGLSWWNYFSCLLWCRFFPFLEFNPSLFLCKSTHFLRPHSNWQSTIQQSSMLIRIQRTCPLSKPEIGRAISSRVVRVINPSIHFAHYLVMLTDNCKRRCEWRDVFFSLTTLIMRPQFKCFIFSTRTVFAQTPILPTYLVALALNDLPSKSMTYNNHTVPY